MIVFFCVCASVCECTCWGGPTSGGGGVLGRVWTGVCEAAGVGETPGGGNSGGCADNTSVLKRGEEEESKEGGGRGE